MTEPSSVRAVPMSAEVVDILNDLLADLPCWATAEGFHPAPGITAEQAHEVADRLERLHRELRALMPVGHA
jgi:hypothetical protein